MNKPTRIIEPPYYKKVRGIKPRSHTSKCMFVRCDDGQEYAVKDLAEQIGIIYTSMKNRIKKWGWDNENVLSEASLMYSVHRRKKEGTNDFSKLGYRDRFHNLDKIKIGTWEQAQL